VCPSTRRPSNLPSPTPVGTYGNPNRKPVGRYPTGVPAHQENGFCNNYSVISTRLCLFNHNRHRALSITCNPTPRPRFPHFTTSTYISIRTITPAQNVPRGTLYVQPWQPGQRKPLWCHGVASRRNHLAGASGLAGWEGVAAFSLARDSSTRFLKSPLSSCSNPL